MKNKIISVSVFDTDTVYRAGLVQIINSWNDFKISFVSESHNNLLYNLTVADRMPDICIMDISIDGSYDYDILNNIKNKWPHLKLMIISSCNSEFGIIKLINLGLNGFISKGQNEFEIYNALVSVYDKDYYYSSSIPEIVFRKAKSSKLLKITPREMEFLNLCCSDSGYKTIADRMGISIRTIESYRDSLYDKLQVKSRMGLMIFALKSGIFPAQKL